MHAYLERGRGARDVVLGRVRATLLVGPSLCCGHGGDNNDAGDAGNVVRGHHRLGLAGRGQLRPALTKWKGGINEGVIGSANDATSPAENVNRYTRVWTWTHMLIWLLIMEYKLKWVATETTMVNLYSITTGRFLS